MNVWLLPVSSYIATSLRSTAVPSEVCTTMRVENTFTPGATSYKGMDFVVSPFSKLSSSRFQDFFHSFTSSADCAAVRLDGSVYMCE